MAAGRGGVQRRIYTKDGEEVGYELTYSDKLLELLLKARDPRQFRENHKLEVTGAEGGPVELFVRGPPSE